MTPDEWQRAGAVFDWRGDAIFHRVAGAGEPILVIHGFPTGSWDWWRIWDRLAAKHRVLTLDLIGFSAKPRSKPSCVGCGSSSPPTMACG